MRACLRAVALHALAGRDDPARGRGARDRAARGDGPATRPGRGFPPLTLLEARSVSKHFGDRQALRDVSRSAAEGEIVAIIGPNGAGKTTLLSIIAGIQKPDGGELKAPPGEVGWVPQQAAVYGKLTVAENLRLFARLERRADVEDAVERMLRQTGLEERA